MLCVFRGDIIELLFHVFFKRDKKIKNKHPTNASGHSKAEISVISQKIRLEWIKLH